MFTLQANFRQQVRSRHTDPVINRHTGQFMDIQGNIVPAPAKPKRHWADPVVMYDTGEKAISCKDSDRLWSENSTLHDELCLRHFGDVSQWWNNRKPEQIQAFLRDFLQKPELVLVQVQKMYNINSGFPIWHFQYRY